jgi:arylformamidase
MTNDPARRIIDLSYPLSASTPAFPGDPAVEVRILDSTERPSQGGERHLNCSQLGMSVHCGTHMDAPFHFFADGRTIDQVPPERCIGPAVLVRLPWNTEGSTIEPRHLARYESLLRTHRRIVLDTGWHKRWGEANYFSEHPLISGEAAQLLVNYGVALVGVDTPSVDRPPFAAHLAFLSNDVLIVENLTNLEAIDRDVFELIAVPLKIAGRDGSPVRALAIV